MANKFNSVGKTSVSAYCLAMSVEALEDQDLKHLALGLSVFPPEKKSAVGWV